MTKIIVEEVRSFLLERFSRQFAAQGRDVASIDDSFDFMTEGLVDSLGVVELIGAVEEKFGKPIDLSELDPEQMTVLGPLSKYISERLK